MKSPDLDRIRSERPLTLSEFVRTYNEDLPEAFPQLTPELLRQFKKTHESLFKEDANGKSLWSLDQHRKRIMDWLPAQTRRVEVAS